MSGILFRDANSCIFIKNLPKANKRYIRKMRLHNILGIEVISLILFCFVNMFRDYLVSKFGEREIFFVHKN